MSCSSIISVRSRVPHPLNALSVGVGCGVCPSCREQLRGSWQSRLDTSIGYNARNGGTSVFLLFTYNNSNLPKWYIETEDWYDEIPCFNKTLVQAFLKSLKTIVWRKYGKGSYKYFLAAEYGEHTRRPHYHALFILAPNVDYVWFVEKCRALWKYGYMFPKSKKVGKNTVYVDNLGAPTDVRVSNVGGSARYVAKYVTKDMSFYSLPQVSWYMDNIYKNELYVNDGGYIVKDLHYKRYIANMLPFHLQSTGLGYELSSSPNFVNYLRAGFPSASDPAHRYMPSTYVFRKFFYKNVKTDRKGLNGQYLYDAVPNDNFVRYFKELFKLRMQSSSKKYVGLGVNVEHISTYANFWRFRSKKILSSLFNRYKFGVFSYDFVTNLRYALQFRKKSMTMRHLYVYVDDALKTAVDKFDSALNAVEERLYRVSEFMFTNQSKKQYVKSKILGYV